MSDSLRPHGLQYTRFPCPSPSPGACSNSCLFRRWCHPTILSSVIPFSSCLQSFPAPGSFSVSQLFASGDKSIGTSASASIPPVNIQDLFPLGLTGLISLQSKSNMGRYYSKINYRHSTELNCLCQISFKSRSPGCGLTQEQSWQIFSSRDCTK